MPGGGTILFVTPTRPLVPRRTRRSARRAARRAIVESIRAGLVFALKEAVGTDEIRRREDDFVRRALDSWGANPQIEILGNPELERLAIVSLGLRHPRGLLHSNFVVAVLNDLFGIQARSGCFCAGPYIHRMYPIDDDWSERDGRRGLARAHGREARVRPRQLQLLHRASRSSTTSSRPCTCSPTRAGSCCRSTASTRTPGQWHHESGRPRPPLTLHDVSFASGALEFRGPRATEPESALAGYLEEARRLVRRARGRARRASSCATRR